MTDMLDELCETSARAAQLAQRYASMLETMPPGMSAQAVTATLQGLAEQQCLVFSLLHSTLECLNAVRAGVPIPAAPPARHARPRLSIVSPTDGAA